MITVVFVHGWGVTDTDCYGQMPARLQEQAAAAGLQIELASIWLSEYVSFDDALTISDLVRAFDHALADLTLPGGSFVAITHSAGGPVLREWLRAQRDNRQGHSTLQLTHLVMLAPANYGSALAQLGKSVLGRLKAWFDGVEPGQRILDWLTLGSAASLSLNLDTIHDTDPVTRGEYRFVLIGDRPDRALYDQLNRYTGEDGSDGVVRLAAANLNARHAVLAAASSAPGASGSLGLTVQEAPRTAFKMIPGMAHSGSALGIMQSAAPQTINAIIRCLQVATPDGYAALCDAFDQENRTRDANKVELEPVGPFAPRVHIHDPCSMLILRLTDESGEPLPTARFMLTGGSPPDPDHMPIGFMLDRQANLQQPATITLFLDYSVLAGDAAVTEPQDPQRILRDAIASHRPYGAIVDPVDLTGLVHHAIAASAQGDDLFDMLAPHQTTVLDVVLPRELQEGVFRLTRNLRSESFVTTLTGALIP